MRLWNDDEWSNFCKAKDHDKVKKALEGQGLKVEGFCNGKPQLSEQGNWYEIQVIVADCLAGKVSLKSSLKEDNPPAAQKEPPETLKPKVLPKKTAGAKKK